MAGNLYGIGVGPGDPELLTLKAVKIMKECDVIAIPAESKESCIAYLIAVQAVPELVFKEILPVSMPMTKDKEVLRLSHEKGAADVIELLDSERQVGFLTLGDPTVYSTYMYIHNRVKLRGYETEIINGIPSFCAVAATLGISLAENKDQVHIFPASYDLSDALSLQGTKIFMKMGKKLNEVRNKIKEAKLEAYMVENCGMENEKIYKTIEEFPEEAGYYSLIIIKN
ncbi:MAG: precorrin-2 C20-methyltransferase [Anaerocolumna sp.]|jgi:precorrin-2/cobalt-factor-2 C20-methyltransferase|nr:precorrin-2 C20-methyltransferase [Anaerocolumna sp.]